MKKKAVRLNRELNTSNLKNELWETLQMVKGKKMVPATANSIAKQSREIMNIVKVEMAAFAMAGQKVDSAYTKQLTGK